MNIIGKLIALIAFVFIILILVNVKNVLPQINAIVFGGSATTSVTALSHELMKQVEAIYPAVSLESYAGSKQNTVQVYSAIRSLTTSKSYSYNSGVSQSGLLTFSQTGNKLSMVTENVTIPDELQGVYHIWLADTARISTSTVYKDFGPIQYLGRQMYIYDLGTSSSEFSFAKYRYVKIINPKTYDIFAESIVQ